MLDADAAHGVTSPLVHSGPTIERGDRDLPNRPWRVLFVVNHRELLPEQVAACVFIERQIAALERAGIEVHVFDLGRGHAPARMALKLLELRRAVRRLAPDIVHGRYGGFPGAFAVLSGCPAVVTFGGGDLLFAGAQRKAYNWAAIALSNLSALAARRVVCVSHELRDALWWRRAEATVIPDGVDLELFVPGQQSQARTKLGWDQDAKIVIADAARDPELKGIAVIRETIARAAVEIPLLRLVELEGIRPERMPLFMQAADALVCASLREGSPNIVKEALACNLPVVSTRVGDVAERLVGVHPSELAERDPAALAAALVRVLRTGRRSNGRASVATLSQELIANRVIEAYEMALGERD